MHDPTVPPPVEAGSVSSSVELEYDHEHLGDGGFEATGTHEWQFDSSAYHEHTGLSLGSNNPNVHQENGHTLRIETAYRFSHSTYGGEDSYTLFIEEIAYRGYHSREKVFWTRGGYYEFDEDFVLTRVEKERQQYPVPERIDYEIPHHSPYIIPEEIYPPQGEDLVYAIHGGQYGAHLDGRVHDLLVHDTPDDAVCVETYKQQCDELPS